MESKSVFSSRRKVPSDTHNKHRVSFPNLAKEVIRISDLILEVIDAREIKSTRNEELEILIKGLGKKILYVINKCDLVDLPILLKSKEMKNIRPYVLVSCKEFIGRKKLRDKIKIEIKRVYAEGKLPKTKQAHVGIIGYPNTGKSSIINLLAGRKVAGSSSESGFTRGIQKIRFSKDILILDTPGVIEGKENMILSNLELKNIASSGIKNYSNVKNPEFIIFEIMAGNPGLFESYYEIDAKNNFEVLIEAFGRKRGYLKKGNQVDIDRTSRIILKDWQEGKIKKKN